MVFELFRKEFKAQHLDSLPKSGWGIFGYVCGLVLGYAALVAVIAFSYYSLYDRVYAIAPTSQFDFLLVICFLTFLCSIIFGTIKARKVIFAPIDHHVLTPLPVKDGDIITAKALYLYLYITFLNLLTTTPVLCVYFARTVMSPPYYTYAVCVAFFVSVFALACALVLSILLEGIYRLLRLSDIAQFVAASLIMVGLCYIYQYILNAFLDGLTTHDGSGMINADLLAQISGIANNLFPVKHVIAPLIRNLDVANNLLIFLGISLVSIFVGYYVALKAYELITKREINLNLKKHGNKYDRPTDPLRALYRKEIDLLFKDSSYTFSYTSLLIMMPFLSYIVLSSLNNVLYDNVRYYEILVPELTNAINILLILLFVGIINSGSAASMSREGACVQIVKYLPIEPAKQVRVKLTLPIALSSFSLLITEILLISTGNIDYKVMLVTLVAGLAIVLATSYYGLYFDMHDKSNTKHKLSYLNTLISVGLPLVLFVIFFLVSMSGLNVWIGYITMAVLPLFLLIPITFNNRNRWDKVYRRMEVNG